MNSCTPVPRYKHRARDLSALVQGSIFPDDPVRPRRCSHETSRGFQGFTHGKDVELRGEAMGRNKRLFEGISTIEGELVAAAIPTGFQPR